MASMKMAIMRSWISGSHSDMLHGIGRIRAYGNVYLSDGDVVLIEVTRRNARCKLTYLWSTALAVVVGTYLWMAVSGTTRMSKIYSGIQAKARCLSLLQLTAPYRIHVQVGS